MKEGGREWCVCADVAHYTVTRLSFVVRPLATYVKPFDELVAWPVTGNFSGGIQLSRPVRVGVGRWNSCNRTPQHTKHTHLMFVARVN